MSTINEKFLNILQNEDFHPGMLSVDSEHRCILATVSVQDIETLIERLQEVKPLIEHYHTERHKEALRLLQDAVGASTTFGSVEELLNSVQGGVKPRTPTTASTNNNHIFEVVLYDSVKDEYRSYKVVNSRMPLALTNDAVYRTIINSNPDMQQIEVFLRAYSEDYRNTYPLNAKWEGKEFHINDRGQLNRIASEYYNEYIKKHPQGNTKLFREYVTTNFKKV